MPLPSIVFTLTPASTTLVSSAGAAGIAPGYDWAEDEDGDLAFPLRFTTGLEAVAQGLKIRLQSFRGEWFRDLEDGVPYFQDLLGHKFSEIKARAAFRDAITETPGVVSLDSLIVAFDRATRALSVSFKVTADAGTISASLALE